jgi:predicted dehydrogenase
MIHIGFIGAGNAASAHLGVMSTLEDVRVSAFSDPVVERAQERVRQHGGVVVPELDDLWRLVDVVWVCSPPHLHVEHAIAAARAGLHVFVERPLAPTASAADQIVQSCRRAGVRLMVGHVLRFVPALERMRQLVADREIGRLVACWSRRSGELSPAELPWWRRDWRRGGGLTFDWGLQELDWLAWIGQAAGSSVRAVHGRVVFSRGDFPEFDDYVRATLIFGSGATGGFDGGPGAHTGGITRAVIGTRGAAITEGRGLRLRYLGDGNERLIDAPPSSDPERHVNAAVLAQDREFVNAVLSGRDPSVTGEVGRDAVALCAAIHQSSREGVEVPVGDVSPGGARPVESAESAGG